MPFRDFLRLLDTLQRTGVPAVIDLGFFGGSSQRAWQTRSTLRCLGLLDAQKRPTRLLRDLAAADAQQRIALLRDITRTAFADAVDLGQAHGTRQQLEALFQARGLHGESIRPAVAFYLHLAHLTGLPVSPRFRRVPRDCTGLPARPPAATARPTLAPDVLAERRSAYIDLLMRLAARSGERSGRVPEELLDRLDRALLLPALSAQPPARRISRRAR
jgi:hypothetical protein